MWRDKQTSYGDNAGTHLPQSDPLADKTFYPDLGTVFILNYAYTVTPHFGDSRRKLAGRTELSASGAHRNATCCRLHQAPRRFHNSTLRATSHPGNVWLLEYRFR